MNNPSQKSGMQPHRSHYIPGHKAALIAAYAKSRPERTGLHSAESVERERNHKPLLLVCMMLCVMSAPTGKHRSLAPLLICKSLLPFSHRSDLRPSHGGRDNVWGFCFYRGIPPTSRMSVSGPLSFREALSDPLPVHRSCRSFLTLVPTTL